VLGQFQQRYQNLRASVAQPQDFDLVFGLAQALHQLIDHALGHRWRRENDFVKAGGIEHERRAIVESERRRTPGRAGEQGRLAEHVARANYPQAPLHAADLLEQPNPSELQQIDVVRLLAISKQHASGREAPPVTGHQPFALRSVTRHGAHSNTAPRPAEGRQRPRSRCPAEVEKRQHAGVRPKPRH
jgi:hypothetical protein